MATRSRRYHQPRRNACQLNDQWQPKLKSASAPDARLLVVLMCFAAAGRPGERNTYHAFSHDSIVHALWP
jgi:hypothetical protein